MNKVIPEFLVNRIKAEYPEEAELILDGLKVERKTTFRVNRIKSNVLEIEKVLREKNIEFSRLEDLEDAFILKNANEGVIRSLEIYKQGKIYLQSLSSMLPVLVLDPKEKENILDMCAAPGGKTTQIASITNNRAFITACEKNKIRYDRLKFNLEKQRVKNFNLMQEDSRNLNDFFKFDKILLDTPCSGSGTEAIYHEIFSQELVERISKVQEALLRKAIKLVNPESTIVYSTCSILKEENERILEKVKDLIEIVPIQQINNEKIDFLQGIKGTVTICPNEYFEGFFVAKLVKK
ncbi:MAG: RsmB/NOP family class I SAM-dependent RNA methyltransferase [Clostridia bacterium]|nr:RsmB/NOP family class I SAM-dependent RNA methyltransferase [Clostridia bacterium]